MFKLIQKETNRYAKQQINKKKQEGLLPPKSVFARWNKISLQEIKKFFAIIIHMSLSRKSSLRDYWTLFIPNMHLLLGCLEIGSLRYWPCSTSITTMQRQLGDSQPMTHLSKFGQLSTHSSQNFRTYIDQKNRCSLVEQQQCFKKTFCFHNGRRRHQAPLLTFLNLGSLRSQKMMCRAMTTFSFFITWQHFITKKHFLSKKLSFKSFGMEERKCRKKYRRRNRNRRRGWAQTSKGI